MGCRGLVSGVSAAFFSVGCTPIHPFVGPSARWRPFASGEATRNILLRPPRRAMGRLNQRNADLKVPAIENFRLTRTARASASYEEAEPMQPFYWCLTPGVVVIGKQCD
jgi:hypothetical protein